MIVTLIVFGCLIAAGISCLIYEFLHKYGKKYEKVNFKKHIKKYRVYNGPLPSYGWF